MTVYCIVSTNDITNEMIKEAINDADTIRYNNDKTKVILKFNNLFPTSMKGYPKYTLEDLLIILEDAEWQSEK